MRKHFKPSERLRLLSGAPDLVIGLTPGRHVLLASHSGEEPRLPSFTEFALSGVNFIFVGELDGLSCGAVELPQDFRAPENLHSESLRRVLHEASAPAQTALSRAAELLFSERRFGFCGCCGSATEAAPAVAARMCPSCGEVFFPSVAPAVIVRISCGEKLLLAHNAKFKPGIYGLIAGFVESGERLEEAVAREVAEEVNIAVRSVRYWGSQSWPFPNSLMVGFTAEYDYGTLRCDGVELLDCGWYGIDELPLLPPPGAIGHAMIDDFIKQVRCKNGQPE